LPNFLDVLSTIPQMKEAFEDFFERRSASRFARMIPICAEHSEGSEEYSLQGAACHACLLVPETSCEARNARLDRGLLTQTVLGGGFPLRQSRSC